MSEPGKASAAASSAARRLAQREVAGVVSVAVVDALQPVEVAEEHRQLPAAREPRGHRLVEPLVQRTPVRAGR